MIIYYIICRDSIILVTFKRENAVAMPGKVAIITMLLPAGRTCPDMQIGLLYHTDIFTDVFPQPDSTMA